MRSLFGGLVRYPVKRGFALRKELYWRRLEATGGALSVKRLIDLSSNGNLDDFAFALALALALASVRGYRTRDFFFHLSLSPSIYDLVVYICKLHVFLFSDLLYLYSR